MTYHVEYFDRHYAEHSRGASAHTVEALQRRLDEREREGWQFRQGLPSSMGWILIFQRREDE